MTNADIWDLIRHVVRGAGYGLDLVEQENEPKGYQPLHCTFDDTHEANEIDNEVGLSPELRRHLRVERRDAVNMRNYEGLKGVYWDLRTRVGQFVADAYKAFPVDLAAPEVHHHPGYVLNNLLYKYKLAELEVAEIDTKSMLQRIGEVLPEVFKDPVMITNLNAFLMNFGVQIVSTARPVPATASAPAEEKPPVVTPPPTSAKNPKKRGV